MNTAERNKIIEKICTLNKRIRNEFVINHKTYKTYLAPPEIYYNDPLGTFSEINLFSNYCIRSRRGCCTPCFYSRIPQNNLISTERKENLLIQLRDSIDYLFIDTPGKAIKKNEKIAAIGLAGSFFSNYESNRNIRKEILNEINQKCINENIKINLFIESHAKDIIISYKTGELSFLVNNFSNINFIHLIGFESKNNFFRNVIYNKFLSIEEFETAINSIHNVNSRSAAFIYIGFPSLSIKDTIEDCKKNIAYLNSLSVIPVLMFSHLQPFNLFHLLYTIDEYNLPDPWCVLECIELLKTLQTNNLGISWLISIEGGPPPPIVEIFTNIKTLACKNCTEKIYSMINNLKRESNWGNWNEESNHLKKCSCYLKYLNMKKTNNKWNEMDFINLVYKAEDNVDLYLKKLLINSIQKK